MKIEVMKENENKLLHRKDLEIVVRDISVTPSKKELVASIAANLGVSESAMVLGSVYQEYGKKEAFCTAKIYESEEWKKNVELKPKVKKVEGEAKEGEKK